MQHINRPVPVWRTTFGLRVRWWGASEFYYWSNPPCVSIYKITNVCISLNEFPYIRYYVPSNHLPLGPLKPIPQNRPPTAQETTSRWRTNLARGSEARAYESQESDYVTKLLAFMVQEILEEHKKENSNFGVRYFSPFSCKLKDWSCGVGIWSSEAKSNALDYGSLHGYGSTFLAWIYLPSHGEWSSSYWRRDKILVCLSWNSNASRCLIYNDLFVATNFNPHLAHMKTKQLCFQTLIPSGLQFGICICVKRLTSLCLTSTSSWKRTRSLKGRHTSSHRH